MIDEAYDMLGTWKGESYSFGLDVLEKIGEHVKEYRKALLVQCSKKSWIRKPLSRIEVQLKKRGVSFTTVRGAPNNTPREDVYRIALEIVKYSPDCIIPIGGGSTIDAAKAASVLASYSFEEVTRVLKADPFEASMIDPYFGTGNVSKMVMETGKEVYPILAVQTASSSAAHLTKYSNVTDTATQQKKLIIDDGLVPKAAVFDYRITVTTPPGLTVDGGVDGLAHLWEVFMSAKERYDLVEKVASTGMSLIIENLPLVLEDLGNLEARVALGLGTDLGGYAIMIGGTSGGHLGSFSLVDVLSHGRACGILNPYYTVFFAPNIEEQLKTVGSIYRDAGYIEGEVEGLAGRELGETVAQGMLRFLAKLGMPTTLKAAGATEQHIEKMADAAKNPQLQSKLLNMPTPMDASRGDVETYMRPILEAAYTGDLSHIEMIEQ